MHRTTQAGIAGQADGTQSICLSDGYSDDSIQGDLISYTEFGGRGANTGSHIADQQLVKGNLRFDRELQNWAATSDTGQGVCTFQQKSDTEYVYLGLFTVTSWSWGIRDGWKILIYQVSPVSGESLATEEVAAALVRGEDIPTQRRRSNINRIVRNYDLAASVRRLYDNSCPICSTRLVTAAGPYSQGAHIRPLGIPHNGPDTMENILCLCPNSHALFDGHALTIQSDGTVAKLGEPYGTLMVDPEHRLNADHIAY